MAQTAAPRRSLEINTAIPDRELIKIDGRSYELADASDFGIDDQLYIERAINMFNRLKNDEDFTDEQMAQAKLYVRQAAKLVLLKHPIIDQEIELVDEDGKGTGVFRHRVTDNQCLQIVEYFGAEAATTPSTVKPRSKKAANKSRQTGANKSRGSKNSTAATRKRGAA